MQTEGCSGFVVRRVLKYYMSGRSKQIMTMGVRATRWMLFIQAGLDFLGMGIMVVLLQQMADTCSAKQDVEDVC